MPGARSELGPSALVIQQVAQSRRQRPRIVARHDQSARIFPILYDVRNAGGSTSDNRQTTRHRLHQRYWKTLMP